MTSKKEFQTSKYTIQQLAELAKVTRRTIRYYVQKGLLPPPIGRGRGSHYDASHLARLIHIRDSQKEGFSLTQLEQDPPVVVEAPSLPVEHWRRLKITDSIELHFKENSLSEAQIQKIMMAVVLLVPIKEEK